MEVNEEPITTMSAFDNMLATMGVDSSGTPATIPDDSAIEEPASTIDEGTQVTATGTEPPATSVGATEDDIVPEDLITSSNGQNATKKTSTPNSAFAELRVKNREATDALEAICAAAGMDPALARDPKQILQMLDDASTTKQAQDMNVPPVLLKRMNDLEKKDAQRETDRLEGLAMKGFNAVKAKYSLTNAELKEFSQQLQAKGVNPFTQEVNLEREYCFENLDKILDKERKAAYAEAQALDKKAAQHSTTPAAAVGKKDDQSEAKIDTMAQFNAFIASLPK